MNNVTQRYLDMTMSTNQGTVITKAEVWTGPTASRQPSRLADLGTVDLSSSWNEDELQSPRRNASFLIRSRGIDYDDLVPVNDDSLLNPLTGNEIRIFHGYRYSDGTEEVTPCGVYRMTKPASVANGTVAITLTLADREWEIARRAWTDPYPITGSPTIDSAIHDAMDNRMPGLTYNFETTDFVVPDTVLGTQPGSGTTPMADFHTMAAAGGMEVFLDSSGVATLRTVPDPTTSPVVAYFLEGPNGTANLLETDFTLDETETYNGVIVISNGAGTGLPIQEAVWVTDPSSPLYPDVFGFVPYFLVNNLITTSDQAIAAGTALLQTLLRSFDDTAFTAVPNAAMGCGDGLLLRRHMIGVDGTFAASAIGMTADPQQPMTVTNRARRSAA